MKTSGVIEHQKARREETVIAIERAKAIILREIKEHGYYPENGGQVTRKEVCRRAAVGYSTLKNKTHEDTRNQLEEWVARTRQSVALRTGTKPEAKTINFQQMLVHVTQQLDMCMILNEDLASKVSSLSAENAKLRAELSRLSGRPLRAV